MAKLIPKIINLALPAAMRQLNRFMAIERVVKRVQKRSMRYPYTGYFNLKWANHVTKDFMRIVRQMMTRKGYKQRIVRIKGNNSEIEIEFYDIKDKRVVLSMRLSSDMTWLFDIYKNGIPLPLTVMNLQYKNQPQQSVAPSMAKPGFGENGTLTVKEGRMYLANWRRILHYIDETL